MYMYSDLVIKVRLREKLFVSEGLMLGLSIGDIDTMRSEFDRDGAVHVSDVCSPRSLSDKNDTAMIEVSTGAEIHQVRMFLDLRLPYTLPLLLCTTDGTSHKLWLIMLPGSRSRLSRLDRVDSQVN